MGRPRSGEYLACITCGVDFYQNQANIRRGRTKYCSKKCVSMAGENNPAWNGGRHLNSAGYVRIRQNGGYTYLHRLVMQKAMGRELRSDEEVHHINGDKLDNRIENLVVMTKQEHAKHHAAIRPKRYCEICDQVYYCRGFCRFHYDQIRRLQPNQRISKGFSMEQKEEVKVEVVQPQKRVPQLCVVGEPDCESCQ